MTVAGAHVTPSSLGPLPDPVLEVASVAKGFPLPRADREKTIRRSLLQLFHRPATRPLQVLEDVSFNVGASEAVGLMGRNGSGKSTLLKIVCGIYSCDRGTVDRKGPVTPVLELGIGWSPHLDAVDNVLLLGTTMGRKLADVQDSVKEILEFAGLSAFAHLELRHYSSGMAARLAWAVAFSSARGLLVLDEVFAVGDAGFRARCERRYRELRAAGHPVLMVSHDPRAIVDFCDRALLLDRGRIVAEGRPEDIVERYLQVATDEIAAGPEVVP